MKSAENILMKWIEAEFQIESLRSRIEILSLALNGFKDDLGYITVFQEMADKIKGEFEDLIDGLETMFEDLRKELKAQEPEGLKV